MDNVVDRRRVSAWVNCRSIDRTVIRLPAIVAYSGHRLVPRQPSSAYRYRKLMSDCHWPGSSSVTPSGPKLRAMNLHGTQPWAETLLTSPLHPSRSMPSATMKRGLVFMRGVVLGC